MYLTKESSSLVCQAVIREKTEREREREGGERDEEVIDSAQHKALCCTSVMVRLFDRLLNPQIWCKIDLKIEHYTFLIMFISIN